MYVCSTSGTLYSNTENIIGFAASRQHVFQLGAREFQKWINEAKCLRIRREHKLKSLAEGNCRSSYLKDGKAVAEHYGVDLLTSASAKEGMNV